MVAALPERRFCVPAPESHRSVASLCLSASWRSHIPFGRLFSCKGSRRANALHLFRTTGWENTPMLSKKVSFFLQDRNVPLTITTGTEKSICAKVFSPTYQVVTKKAKLAKDFPSTFQVVTDFRFCTKVFAFFTLPLLYWYGNPANYKIFFHYSLGRIFPILVYGFGKILSLL